MSSLLSKAGKHSDFAAGRVNNTLYFRCHQRLLQFEIAEVGMKAVQVCHKLRS